MPRGIRMNQTKYYKGCHSFKTKILGASLKVRFLMWRALPQIWIAFLQISINQGKKSWTNLLKSMKNRRLTKILMKLVLFKRIWRIYLSHTQKIAFSQKINYLREPLKEWVILSSHLERLVFLAVKLGKAALVRTMINQSNSAVYFEIT